MIFISYARANANTVRDLSRGLENLRHQAYFDEAIPTGQPWWDEILRNIRDCYAFIFALSPESARSNACRRELQYAIALRKPIFPLKIKRMSDEEAPRELRRLNIRNFVGVGPEDPAYGELDDLLDRARDHPTDLPDPLPAEPAAPITDLSEAERLIEADHLDEAQQEWLAAELERVAENEDDRHGATILARRLRARTGLIQEVAESLDRMLIRYSGNRLDLQDKIRLEGLVMAIQEQRCVPILGTGMSDWLFGSRRSLARQWANEFEFPMHFTRKDDLPQVAQYVSVQRGGGSELRFLLRKFYIDQLYARFGHVLGDRENTPPDLDALIVKVWEHERVKMPAEPHTVAARLGARVYVTSEVTSLLAEALRKEGREPVVDYCRWLPTVRRWPDIDDASDVDDDWEPSVQRPLVYHLFGSLKVPQSLVITEDDYFDFLASVAAHSSHLIPTALKEAVAESSLLILGFGLQDWGIRVLLRSLVSPEVSGHLEELGHVAAEFDLDTHAESPEGARDYVAKYYGIFRTPKVHIFWSSPEAFCADLATQLGNWRAPA